MTSSGSAQEYYGVTMTVRGGGRPTTTARLPWCRDVEMSAEYPEYSPLDLAGWFPPQIPERFAVAFQPTPRHGTDPWVTVTIEDPDREIERLRAEVATLRDQLARQDQP